MSESSSSGNAETSALLNNGSSKSSGSSSSTFFRKRKKKELSTLQKIFQSQPGEYTTIKSMICFPIGCAIALLFHMSIIQPITMDKDTKNVVGGALGLSVAVGFGMNTQVRCIITLVLPIFFGKSGRSYVAAFAFVYLIGGPITNLISNATEVVRSLSCITQLLANHTATKWELRFKPLGDSLKELQKRGFMTKYVHKRFDKTFKPIKKEIEDQDEIDHLKKDTEQADKLAKGSADRSNKIEERYAHPDQQQAEDEKTEKRWEKKLDYRCEDVFSKGVVRCREWFKDTYDTCLDDLPLIGYLLCLPMKLDVFCELIRFAPGVAGINCNSNGVMNPGLGEIYVAAKKMTGGMEKKMKVNLQYKLVKSGSDLNYMTAEEVRKKTLKAFERRKVMVEFFTVLLQRTLAFTFMLVFISAFKYNQNYLSDFRYDNNYITAYFKRIDARRKVQDKRVLLPLKRLEKNDVIFPSTPKLQKRENRKLIKGTIKLLFRVIISGVVVMMDHLLYSVLDVIGKNSHIDYQQTGEHHIDIKVYGKGFMGDIVKLFLTSFNQRHEIDQITTNVACLPRPSKVDKTSIYLMFGIYVAVWVLLYLQAYGLRLRRVIAGFYYRKREKRRILYVYNEMLKKRKGYLRHMRHKVRKQVKNRELKRKTSMLVAIKNEFPTLCCFLFIFISKKDTCLICEDTEGRGFYKCPTSGCNFGYCAECWEDIKEICYACLNEDSDSSSTGDDSGSDDSDDSDTDSD